MHYKIKEDLLNTVVGGVSSASVQESLNLESNERALIMKELLQGLSFGPVAPECTDIRR